MKAIVRATAPTVYQRTSISYFGMPVIANRDGSFEASQEFNSEEEAKEFLKERAELYLDNDPEATDEKKLKMLSEIEQFGCLRLDAANASIEIQN